MKLEEYETRLEKLERENLPWTEFKQKMAELQAEYLVGQLVPDAEKAIALILEAQQRGELPEIDTLVGLDDGKNCQLLELNDNGRPDEQCWRCRVVGAEVDVMAESGEVCLLSV